MIWALFVGAMAQGPQPLPHTLPEWDRWAVVAASKTGTPERLLLFGPRQVWEVSPDTAAPAQVADGNFVDAVRFDLNRDWMGEVLLCGPDGIFERADDGTLNRVIDLPCRALTALQADQPVLIVASERLWSFTGPDDGTPFGAVLPSGSVALHPHEDRLAVRHADGLELWEPGSHRHLHMDLAPDGVAPDGERSWAWTVNGDVQPKTDTVFFGDARSVVAADLDADGHSGLYALHPSAALVGGAEGLGDEQAYPLPFAPRDLAVSDWNGDGGGDVLVLGTDRLAVWTASGPPPARQVRQMPFLDVPTRPMWGINMPLFQDTDGQFSSGRTPPARTLVGGVGWAWGSQLGGADGVGLSPTFSVTMDRGVGRRFQSFIGVDASPLMLQVGDGFFAHLAMLSGGVTAGNPHLRAGPIASVGIVGLGVGARVIWTPFERPSGTLQGLEWRTVIYGGAADAWRVPSGEISLSYVQALAMGGAQGSRPPTRAPVARAASDRSTRGPCRRFGGVLGVSAGASNTRSSWDFVGRNVQFDIAATPSASGWCEIAAGPVAWLFSLDSAPFFRYRVPWDRGQADQTVRQMGSLTFGPTVGGDAFRIGPIAAGGVWMSGIGARMQLTPIGGDAFGHHGLEARALYLVPSVGAGQATLGYTFWMDPRQ